MRSSLIRQLILICTIGLALPVMGYAQEAVLIGTVTDATGGVLPGVSVRAVHEASGNTFEIVTDERGAYRIPVRIGVYRITAELSGFTGVTRSGLELLVGQTAVINVQMSPSALQETITVTGEPPLIETATSSLSGNIDSRQMSELPVQGRGWTALALLAPGNRTTAFGATPVQDRGRNDTREFQINIDGQQVSEELGLPGGPQPRFSRDSIAEFQFISNRFDATQGRSMGVQVNAVTKSGTNAYSGSFGGYFRDAGMNAKDPVLNLVLPYSNQQLSGTVGGPIRLNKLHFFANYEYEREPLTSIWQTQWPSFNITVSGKRSVNLGGARLDYQISPRMHLMGKVSAAKEISPFAQPTSNHPAEATRTERPNREELVHFTQVLSNRALNEVKAGYSLWKTTATSLSNWSRHPLAPIGITNGSPRIRFRGFNILAGQNLPQTRQQGVYVLRDDLTLSYTAGGRHDLKAGAEWLYRAEDSRSCYLCMGQIDARNGPVPANIEALFPDPFNADTWNLAALSPITRRYSVGVGLFRQPNDQNKIGSWAQDDWKISNHLTLNLGVRYDVTTNAYANGYALPPFLEAGRPNDTNNVQPRFGAAYTLNDRTVLRGGVGLYYADVLNDALWTITSVNVNVISVENDGRPNFASNPFNGPLPTLEQARLRYCYVQNVPGCLRRDANEMAPPAGYSDFPHSWQTSIGVARQMGSNMAIEVDYVSNRNHSEKVIQDNMNLTFNPATGINYPFSDISRRAFPDWGITGMVPNIGRSNYRGLQSVFTKRLSHRWQGSANYLLSGLWNSDGLPLSGLKQVTFAVAPDLGNDYALAESDQRHRLVFNGIWQAGYGFQVSGIYFYGSGERMQSEYGGDFRDLGVTGLTGTERVRPDGTIIPRNDFVGKPVHRVDMRIQRRFPIVGRAALDGLVEVFNLFDRANYGSYTLDQASSQYRVPISNRNLAYRERGVQLGFRATF